MQTTSFFLHIIAMVCMLFDHIWGTSILNYDVFNCIGRLAFPIFAFMIVEGYFHTKNLKKYVIRLLLFAILSELPFNLMMGSRLFYPIHQNVLWSFLISIGLIHWNEKVRAKKLWLRILVALTTIVIAYVGGIITFVDYYNAGILMVLTFYFFRGKKWWKYLGQLLCLWYINCEILGGLGKDFNIFGRVIFVERQAIALLSLIPIWLYSGKQGYYNKKMQYIYYFFYPAHMLLLCMIKWLLPIIIGSLV